MADMAQINWKAIDADPRFQTLHRKKTMFLWGLMVFSMVYYFLLPLANGLAPGFMRTDVIGHVNIAYLFALSQFVMAWLLAWLYIRKANSVFDRLAAMVRERAARGRRTTP